MKMITLALNSIKPNPFKKHINEGNLDKERVAKLVESIEHGTLPEIFTVRKQGEEFELCFGHHRLEALKQKKGKDYEVQCPLVEYSDETMLVDLVRENISQRDSSFQDTEDSIVLTRTWLESKVNSVKQFDKIKKTVTNPKGAGRAPYPDSFRSIAKFLSKNGKTLSHETIRKYLLIHDNLDNTLYKNVRKLEHAKDEEIETSIGIRTAAKLATLANKETQRVLWNKINKEKLNNLVAEKAITAFKEADDLTKEMVKDGKIKLTEIAKPQPTKSVEESEEEQSEKEINLMKRFWQSSSEFINCLLLLRQLSLTDITTGERKRVLATIKDASKAMAKTFEHFEKED